jgi:hypothetical protein
MKVSIGPSDLRLNCLNPKTKKNKMPCLNFLNCSTINCLVLLSGACRDQSSGFGLISACTGLVFGADLLELTSQIKFSHRVSVPSACYHVV